MVPSIMDGPTDAHDRLADAAGAQRQGDGQGHGEVHCQQQADLAEHLSRGGKFAGLGWRPQSGIERLLEKAWRDFHDGPTVARRRVGNRRRRRGDGIGAS